MGWKGYELKMPVGMIFKKMYCGKCGAKLQKHKVSTVYKKGDPGYENHLNGHSTIGMNEKEHISYVYQCPDCYQVISYREQLEVAKIQKSSGSKIIHEESQD